MKMRVAISLVVAAALAAGAAAALPGPAVLGAGKGEKAGTGEKASKDDKGKKGAKATPGELTKKVAIAPKELQFGMTLEQAARVYDKVFDKEFLPLYRKAEPGTQMAALDAELRDKKALLRRNRIDFGKDPTGVDYTPLKTEYTYGNAESMSRVPLRNGTMRNLFFINERLWKIYDEHKLRAGGPLGENYEQAIAALTERFETPPKVLEADYPQGRPFDEAHWQDNALLIRVLNRGEGVLGIVYVDRAVYDNIGKYRTHKPRDPHELDREVKAATARPPQQPGPPPSEQGEADKKGNKKK